MALFLLFFYMYVDYFKVRIESLGILEKKLRPFKFSGPFVKIHKTCKKEKNHKILMASQSQNFGDRTLKPDNIATYLYLFRIMQKLGQNLSLGLIYRSAPSNIFVKSEHANIDRVKIFHFSLKIGLNSFIKLR